MNERISLADKKNEVKSRNPVPQVRRKNESSQSMNSPVDRIQYLQRTIGNQAVQRLMKSGALQAKLRIGQPGDIYEQEADMVAEQVMRMPDVSSSKDTGIQRKCPKCRNGLRGLLGRDKKDERLQAKEATGEILEVAPHIEANIKALKGGGHPLPESTRAFFEQRFGHDFSRVRVHSGGAAEQSARDLSARAYTVGQNVVFGANQFAPGSTEGRRLLAHELTHVIQQGGADYTVVPDTESETGDSGLQKHETIIADETVGYISRQAMPKLSSGLMLQRAACPCCAESISISNISRIDNATHMGHSFDTNMGLSYPASGPSGSCTLEWWEKTNVPYTPGMSPNTWTDMYQLLGGASFDSWNNRREECATSSLVKDTDPPSLGKTPGRTVTRTLEFRININSMPPTSEGGCTAASQQVTAKQVLTMVNAAPDWAASSFTTP